MKKCLPACRQSHRDEVVVILQNGWSLSMINPDAFLTANFTGKLWKSALLLGIFHPQRMAGLTNTGHKKKKKRREQMWLNMACWKISHVVPCCFHLDLHLYPCMMRHVLHVPMMFSNDFSRWASIGLATSPQFTSPDWWKAVFLMVCFHSDSIVFEWGFKMIIRWLTLRWANIAKKNKYDKLQYYVQIWCGKLDNYICTLWLFDVATKKSTLETIGKSSWII